MKERGERRVLPKCSGLPTRASFSSASLCCNSCNARTLPAPPTGQAGSSPLSLFLSRPSKTPPLTHTANLAALLARAAAAACHGCLPAALEQFMMLA